eukprot:TRINITY_DN3063_c0_g1_i1.p1 TRINITY_DN3063_c0_g1~~TRINITY_DN3063_c0_g1_i1.p1  ORF type:complete len:260 (-),score=69.50 TRINITY_DN3063_c0_g1_i1:436-1215(-)
MRHKTKNEYQNLEGDLERIDIDPEFTELFKKCGIRCMSDVGNLNIKALKELLDFLMARNFTKDDRQKLFKIWKDAQRSMDILHWFSSLGKLEGEITTYTNVLYLLGVESVNDLQGTEYTEEFFRVGRVPKADQEVFLRCRPHGIDGWLVTVIGDKGKLPAKYTKIFVDQFNCHTTHDLVNLYIGGQLGTVLRNKGFKTGHRPKIKRAVSKLIPRHGDSKPVMPRGGPQPSANSTIHSSSGDSGSGVSISDVSFSDTGSV